MGSNSCLAICLVMKPAELVGCCNMIKWLTSFLFLSLSPPPSLLLLSFLVLHCGRGVPSSERTEEFSCKVPFHLRESCTVCLWSPACFLSFSFSLSRPLPLSSLPALHHLRMCQLQSSQFQIPLFRSAPWEYRVLNSDTWPAARGGMRFLQRCIWKFEKTKKRSNRDTASERGEERKTERKGRENLRVKSEAGEQTPASSLILHNTQSHAFSPVHLPLFLSSSSYPPTTSLVAGRQFKWTFNPNQRALWELAGLPSPKWRGKWIH